MKRLSKNIDVIPSPVSLCRRTLSGTLQLLENYRYPDCVDATVQQKWDCVSDVELLIHCNELKLDGEINE